MRLAIVRQHYDSAGAVERVVEPALEALLERNVAVSIVAREPPQTRLQLVDTAICDPFHAGGLWRDAGFARAACRAIRRIGPTLVEAHEPLPCCDVYRACDGVHASRLEALRRRPSGGWRVTPALSPRRHRLLRAERRMFASPWLCAVICASPMVRDDIRDRFGLPEAKLHVIPDPVDGDAFQPGVRAARDEIRRRQGMPAEAVTFLALAGDFATSSVVTAVEALAAVPAPAHLVVVGDDPDIGRLRARARAQGTSGRVTFAGAQADLRPWYGCADVVVLPSLYDPAVAAAHGAMACGLPVVASTGSGAAQRVREHDAGSVYDAGDAAALATCMYALTDSVLHARQSANACRAVAELTPRAITLQLVLLYRDLLAGGMRASTIAPRVPRAGDGTADDGRG